MTVREFVKRIRIYPDWDVDILIADGKPEAGTELLDITDVAVNETTGDIIILPAMKSMYKNQR